MTQQKKLKKAIRARSQKTGESYTAARRQLLAAREKTASRQPASPEPPAAPPALEARADAVPAPAAPSRSRSLAKGGVRDEAVREKTGHGLEHWFAVLDAFGAAAKGHTATAAHLQKEHGVPGWYAQGITVAYERAMGLREKNQSCTGKFQVSVSKTVAATVTEVADALASAERRAAWLAGADPGLRRALDAAFTGEKPRQVKTKGSDYAWLRYSWDGRPVAIYINAKPNGRASVVADSQNLEGTAQVEERRAQWRAALAGLHRHLGG